MTFEWTSTRAHPIRANGITLLSPLNLCLPQPPFLQFLDPCLMLYPDPSISNRDMTSLDELRMLLLRICFLVPGAPSAAGLPSSGVGFTEDQTVTSEADEDELALEEEIEVARPNAPTIAEDTGGQEDLGGDEDDEAERVGSLVREEREAMEESLKKRAALRKFTQYNPGKTVGKTSLSNTAHRSKLQSLAADPQNKTLIQQLPVSSKVPENAPYFPFSSKADWDFANWAKFRGTSASALDELLKIDGLVDSLGLSFKSSAELNKIVDQLLPPQPQFKRETMEHEGEIFDLYYRDVIECIRALFGDPDLAPYLKYAPEKHYTDETRKDRVYHDMHTGQWWWDTQVALGRDGHKDATIIPVLISTDKSQLTYFRNKSVYPVYMTLGNIPKEIRRKPTLHAYVLLGYLPTSRMEHITDKNARRETLANLYHRCMSKILSPLREAGMNGIQVSNGNGHVKNGFPIFACFIGDNPEQVLVAGTIGGDCVECKTKKKHLADPPPEPGQDPPYRDLHAVLDLLDSFANGMPYEIFAQHCKKKRIKPIPIPFWHELPYVDIYRSITPDVLHQLYQGVMKHLIKWLLSAYSPTEIDARCRRLPPNHNTRLFIKGISSLSKLTGQEHAEVCQIILGLIIGIPLPNGHAPAVVRCLRGALDFLYLAQYPAHTSKSLDALDDALRHFHADKEVFVKLGIRQDFYKISKIHTLQHYVRLIRLFGTVDNTNTEYTERLHIDLAKDAYRATNRKDELPQMTTWLERREQMIRHAKFVEWQLLGCPSSNGHNSNDDVWLPPGLHETRNIELTIHPSAPGVRIDEIKAEYGAPHFHDCLARYIVRKNHPEFTGAQVEHAIQDMILPFTRLDLWHQIKYTTVDQATLKTVTVDSIHAKPRKSSENKDPRNLSRPRVTPGRFDTVIVSNGTGTESGVRGRRIARLRVIFEIPADVQALFLRPGDVPTHLAYVEWFTPFPRHPDPTHRLYKISYSHNTDGTRQGAIIPLGNITRSIHLFPHFGRAAPTSWTSYNVLDMSPRFYCNVFTDKQAYRTLF